MRIIIITLSLCITIGTIGYLAFASNEDSNWDNLTDIQANGVNWSDNAQPSGVNWSDTSNLK